MTVSPWTNCYISHWSKVSLQLFFNTLPLHNFSLNVRLKVSSLACWQLSLLKEAKVHYQVNTMKRARGMEIMKNLKWQDCSNTLYYNAVLSSISIWASHWSKTNSKCLKRGWYNFPFDLLWYILSVDFTFNLSLPQNWFP